MARDGDFHMAKDSWSGDRVEAWRVDTSVIFWRALAASPVGGGRTNQDDTFADWTSPWVDPGRVSADRADWNRFFYYDLRAGDRTNEARAVGGGCWKRAPPIRTPEEDQSRRRPFRWTGSSMTRSMASMSAGAQEC